MRSRLVLLALAMAGAMTLANADTLHVSGTVTDSISGAAVEGAIVSVRVGRGGAAQTVLDTTDAQGKYAVTFAENTDTSVRVTVTSNGYMTALKTTPVANPADNTTDRVTVDFRLRPTGTIVPTDTTRIFFVATVLDSGSDAAVSGATVVITALIGLTVRTTTVTTDAEGKLATSAPWGRVQGATATVSKTGYVSRVVTAQTRNDSINFGTIKLVAVSAGDSLDYRFRGRVVSQTGNGLNDAVVTVVMKSGNTTIFEGKDTTARVQGQAGGFSLITRQPYSANLSVTVSVTLEGYQSFDTTFTPMAGINPLLITLKQPTAVISRIVPVTSMQGAVSRYLVNGRFAAVAPKSRLDSRQTIIVRTGQNSGTVSRKSMNMR